MFPNYAFASTSIDTEALYNNEANVSRENKIMELIDERLKIVSQNSVNIEQLNEVDIKLIDLGVDFLTKEEVKEKFPDAYEAKEVDTKRVSDQNTAIARVSPPDSYMNTWMSYRESGWYYNGNRYNIQKLIATPISTSSSLWKSGNILVNYGTQWQAGATNFLSSIASTLFNDAPIYAYGISIYQAFQSVWSGLQPISEISKPEILYSYNCKATASFAYVRLESEADDLQKLSHISTKCWTNVSYVLKGGTWRRDSSGNWELCPTQPSGNYDIYNNPYSYNSTAEAVYAFTLNALHNKSISNITISGPESKTIVSIYPICPQFPLHCEY